MAEMVAWRKRRGPIPMPPPKRKGFSSSSGSGKILPSAPMTSRVEPSCAAESALVPLPPDLIEGEGGCAIECGESKRPAQKPPHHPGSMAFGLNVKNWPGLGRPASTGHAKPKTFHDGDISRFIRIVASNCLTWILWQALSGVWRRLSRIIAGQSIRFLDMVGGMSGLFDIALLLAFSRRGNGFGEDSMGAEESRCGRDRSLCAVGRFS